MENNVMMIGMAVLNRYFGQPKWKDETGCFRYPKGKKAHETLADALYLAFGEDVIWEREYALRGDTADSSGIVVLARIKTGEEHGPHLSFVLTGEAFMVLPIPDMYNGSMDEILSKPVEKTAENDPEDDDAEDEKASTTGTSGNDGGIPIENPTPKIERTEPEPEKKKKEKKEEPVSDPAPSKKNPSKEAKKEPEKQELHQPDLEPEEKDDFLAHFMDDMGLDDLPEI